MKHKNIQADLEICNKATQGPWEHRYNSEFSEIYANSSNASVAIVGHNPYDADFIVHAREGWPHAIKRVVELENIISELTDALGGLLYYVAVGEMYTDRFFLDCELYESILDRAINLLEK